MKLHRSCLALLGAVLTLTAAGLVFPGQAQSVWVEGTTSGSSGSNILFYSWCPFDQATLIVKSGNAQVSVDFGAPESVSQGSRRTANYRIVVNSGSINWALEVKNVGSVSLKSAEVFEQHVSSGPQKWQKVLFEGKWNPWESWVVVSLKTGGSVYFPYYENLPYLRQGDHVFSLSSIGEAVPCPALLAVISHGHIGAKMWKLAKG